MFGTSPNYVLGIFLKIDPRGSYVIAATGAVLGLAGTYFSYQDPEDLSFQQQFNKPSRNRPNLDKLREVYKEQKFTEEHTNTLRQRNPMSKRSRSDAGFARSKQGSAKSRKTNGSGGGGTIVQVPQTSAPIRLFVPRTPGGQIVSENHYFDAELNTNTITPNGTSWTGTEYDPAVPLNLCSPTIGDDITNRTARRIFVKKIRIQGQVFQNAQTTQSAADDAVYVRIVVYQDKQTNGSQAQGEQLLSSGTSLDAIDMYQNTANLGRFRVLKEKRIHLENPNIVGLTGAYVVNGLSRSFKFNIPINQFTNFNSGNTGTITDIIDNSYHIVANISGGTGVTTSITYKSRAVFTG